MQFLLVCAQRASNATANEIQNSTPSLDSFRDRHPRGYRSIYVLDILPAVSAGLYQGRSMYSRKLTEKVCRVRETIHNPAGVQRYSKCLKAQPQLSPPSLCWGWQGMAITGYVDPWSKTMLLQTALRLASSNPGMKPRCSFELSLSSVLCHTKGILTPEVS